MPTPAAIDPLPICTHCGFTWGEYRARGLLGCPHCYVAFGEALRDDLRWIHQAAGAVPAEAGEDPAARAERLAHLREQLADALRREDYAEAARLRRLVQDSGGAGAAPREPGHGLR